MVTKAAPKDNTKITKAGVETINISNGDLTVAMAPDVVRVATSITRICSSRWGSRINKRIRVRDRVNTKCLCQDKPKKVLAIKRWTRLSSQLLAKPVAVLTRKWCTRLRSQSLTKMEDRQ